MLFTCPVYTQCRFVSDSLNRPILDRVVVVSLSGRRILVLPPSVHPDAKAPKARFGAATIKAYFLLRSGRYPYLGERTATLVRLDFVLNEGKNQITVAVVAEFHGVGHQSCLPGILLATAQPVGYIDSFAR